MALKKYSNSAWQDISSLKKYKDNAWQDCIVAKKYKDGAWQDIWSRDMIVKLDHVGMYGGATYDIALRDNGYGINYYINGVATAEGIPHAIVLAINNLNGFYETTVRFTFNMEVSPANGGLYLMRSDVTTKLFESTYTSTNTISQTYSLNGEKNMYFVIDTHQQTQHIGYLTNVYVNGNLLRFSI